jgi:serine/threonine protein kinase
VLCQVTDALEHIHRRGIIHGDIKADNIMVVAENIGARRRHAVKLLDFGLARRNDSGSEELVSGSPHYLAPERATGGPPSVSADIYALGVLGYVLLTGSVPFDGEVMEILMAQVQDEPEAMSKRRGEELDERLESLITRAMSKQPADRHRDAAAFRYELNAAMDMLDLGRRRSAPLARISAPIPVVEEQDPRERAILSAFDRSRLPQALVSVDGQIVASNRAFSKLLGLKDAGAEGHDLSKSSLADTVSGLMKELRKAHVEGKAHERRAVVQRADGKPPFTLILWIVPTKDTGAADLHIVVRIEGT